MIRTQIQLPGKMMEQAKKVCKAREISFTELARRGMEYILSVYSVPEESGKEWEPPKPRSLGWKGLSDKELKTEAQKTAIEYNLTHL